MNTRAIDTALPQHRYFTWDRVRGLYNGVGYIVALSSLLAVWFSVQALLPRAFSGQWQGFGALFVQMVLLNLYSMVPGPLVVPPMVNLAPRSGPARIIFLLMAVVPMSWWCLAVVGGVHFDFSWPSLGYALDGLMTTSMVVGVCAFHSYSREAADSLLGIRISRTQMTAELQRAQLRLLRAQIEPHFLFNTLSVVRALARSDRAATVQMLDNLIHYFAAALPRLSGNEVTLAQELQLVDAYLKIYQARMGSRLTFEISLPQDLEAIQVPSMIVLTLVENALKHGVGPTLAGGSICISAARECDRLKLAVADSGRGLDLSEGHGAGLANIRQRLLMMYGAEALLSLKRVEPHGMIATMLLPVS